MSCMSGFKYHYSLSDHGVDIQMDSMSISIDIMDTGIIHVVKNKGKRLEVPEYVVTMLPKKIKWNVETKNGKLIVSTDKMTAEINEDGLIRYYNADKVLTLSETDEMTYVRDNEYGTSVVSQGFVAGDEALYGLGQFQSGMMNWKNIPVRLDQFNQEVTVPFLVSTKGYGIYWNNYSITDVNLPHNEIEFSDVYFKTESQELNVKNGQEIENVAEHKTKNFREKNIRETVFVPKKNGRYTFLAESSILRERMRGDVKVIIDNDTIINYTTVWVPSCFSGLKDLEAGKEYKVIFQNTGSKIPGRLLYNEPDYNKTVFTSVSGASIDYYVVIGNNPSEILAGNHQLTGKVPLLSKKAYGLWQCRERYHNQEELLMNANEMRKRKIPVDFIIQDWFYWPENTKGPEWDRAKYPDPKGMIEQLKNLNIDLLVSVWPEVRNEPMLEKYDLERLKFHNNSNLDFYNKEVRDRYYKMLSDSMFHIGVEGIWSDGTEPSGKPSEETETAVGKFRDVHNIYSLEVMRSIFEGREKEYPGRRTVGLTRSAYSGQQRYGAVTWSGDVAATWEQLLEQVAAGLNFTMSGIPYWTHDIGGFFRDSKSMNPIFDSQYTNMEYKELLTRWFQFGTFSPIFRIHGYVSQTEIWRYGTEFERFARKYIDLRYQLLPYIYSEAWKVYKGGHLMMSPLAFYYPQDKNTWSIKDQYFFGENIMVGIVTEYKQREKEMYLPSGEWYDFWTGKKYSGSQDVMVSAPLDQNPLFVKAGSIIPYGPKLQYATQQTDKPIVFKVYPGSDAEYVLYFDDNMTTDYQKGKYSEVLLKYLESDKTLSITSIGQFVDWDKNPMNFEIEVVGDCMKDKLKFDGTPLVVNLSK